MNPLYPIAGIGLVLWLLSRNQKAPSTPVKEPDKQPPGTGLDPLDYSEACGVYPALTAQWRPVCIGARLKPDTALTPGTTVETTIQEGRRPVKDSNEMARIVATVIGGSPASGFDLVFYGVIKEKHAVTKPLPPVGTVFKAVPPAFINRVLESPYPSG